MNFQINIFVYLAVIAIVGFQLYRMGKSVGWEKGLMEGTDKVGELCNEIAKLKGLKEVNHVV